MKIWKFGLRITDRQSVSMPRGATLLSVQVQHGSPQLWAMVDESQPMVEVVLDTYGTGNPMPENPGLYVATYQVLGGDLVWHVFEWQPLVKEKLL